MSVTAAATMIATKASQTTDSVFPLLRLQEITACPHRFKSRRRRRLTFPGFARLRDAADLGALLGAVLHNDKDDRDTGHDQAGKKRDPLDRDKTVFNAKKMTNAPGHPHAVSLP